MQSHMTQQLNTALQIVGDGPEHPDFDTAWECLALSKHAAIRAAMRQALEETFGPYPPPTGYSDAGEPFWETTVMARYLGIPVDQINETALEMQEKWGADVGVLETEKLHRIH
ncbi:MAG: hypothetical protein HQL87_07280 [Magnetococcales bacterium]|nr:hypothetical protein [Magnetococcales bacterium]